MPLSRTLTTASLPSRFSGEPDVPAALCVLGGVVQQVQEHLSEPDGIGVQMERLWRQADSEFVTALIE